MSVSFDPVGNWFVVAAFAVVVTGLTVWAYLARLRTSTGFWRWIALGLRLAAVLLCLIAALRPSVVFQEKKKQPASLIFLCDDSKSMTMADEASGQSRWDLARKTLTQARAVSKNLGDGLSVKYFRFDKGLRDDSVEDTSGPEGKSTAYGQALLDVMQRETGTRVAAVVVLGDGSNNAGPAPLSVARRMRTQEVPIFTVGLGAENAGSKSRDIAVRDLVTSPTVFVKNNIQVKGTLLVRGFPNERLDLELFVEGQNEPVATQRIKVPASADLIPFSGLNYRPQTAGEKRITVRVKPKEGELVPTNNEYSTFITVMKGGLNVLFVQGPHAPWEQKFWMLSVASSPDIQADLRVVRSPARDSKGELTDDDFTPGRYDVYVLSDLPADFLTAPQQALLAHAVEKRGAGLIMLGGRSSFGAGGWDRTEIARVLPVNVSARDPQIEPEAGVKFVPNLKALDNYLLQIGSTREESQRLWALMPALSGINHLGTLKESATVFGQSADGRAEPIMVGSDVGSGRVLAFGGETWVWARASNETRLAHRKFWRQVIFWLAHKEDKGENEIKVRLDARRIASGQSLDFHVTARDAKGSALTGLKIETRVTLEGDPKTKYSEPVDVFKKGEESQGTFFASQAPPGDYRVSVVATRDGKEVGHDSARFIVYQDDREMENPAADRALLRQMAETSGGEFVAPEQLPKFLQSLRGKLSTETYSQTERKVWDNWPFLLLFTSLLMLEWFLRKRHGWV